MSMDKRDSCALINFGSNLGKCYIFLGQFVSRMLEIGGKNDQEAFRSAWDYLLAWSNDGEQTFFLRFKPPPPPPPPGISAKYHNFRSTAIYSAFRLGRFTGQQNKTPNKLKEYRRFQNNYRQRRRTRARARVNIPDLTYGTEREYMRYRLHVYNACIPSVLPPVKSPQ